MLIARHPARISISPVKPGTAAPYNGSVDYAIQTTIDWQIVPPEESRALSATYNPEPNATGKVELVAALLTPKLEDILMDEEGGEIRAKMKALLESGKAIPAPAFIRSGNTVVYDFTG